MNQIVNRFSTPKRGEVLNFPESEIQSLLPIPYGSPIFSDTNSQLHPNVELIDLTRNGDVFKAEEKEKK